MRARPLPGLFAALALLAGGPAGAGDAPAQAPCDLACQDETFYPLGANGMKAEGEVRVRACYSAPGRADEATLERSSGHPELDRAAVDVVLRGPEGLKGPLKGDGPYKRTCRTIKVVYRGPPEQHAAEPTQLIVRSGGVSIEWPSDSRGSSPLPVASCDARCQKEIHYPAGPDGQLAPAHVHLNACFDPEGRADIVTLNFSKYPPELAQAARSLAATLVIAPFDGTGMPPRRCHMVTVAFQPAATPAD